MCTQFELRQKILNSVCKNYHALLMFAITSLLFGCSSTTLAYKDTLMLAFVKEPDVNLSQADIAAWPSSAIYVRRDDRARVLLSLVEKSADTKKWISADQGLFNLRNGRITKLTGFDLTLEGLIYRQQDWLTLPMQQRLVGQKAKIVADWAHVQDRGLVSDNEIIAMSDDTLNYYDQAISTVRIDERVEFSSGQEVINHFWFAKSDGLLLKSIQQPHPNWSVFEIEHISDIVAVLSEAGR